MDDTSVSDAVEMSSVSSATEIAPVAGVKRPFETMADITVDEDYGGGDDVDV